MTRRIVLHAGFHKTGTSTTQAMLAQNGKHIWPTFAIVLPGRLSHVLRMATLHSALRDPLSLTEMRQRMRDFLETLDLGEKRGMVLSAENLMGLIPGRKEVVDYGAAPALLAETVQAVLDAFGEVEIDIVLTLRDRESWLRSSYWQNLRSSRLQESWEDYADRLRQTVDLPGTAEAIRTTVPDARVSASFIEAFKGSPLGPASPVIDAMGLPTPARLALTPVSEVRNATPDSEIIAQILKLNRSDMRNDDCKRAKADLLGLANV